MATGKEIRKIEGQNVSSPVAFSPDGKTLASGSEDQTIRLWDVASGKELRKIEGHKAVVHSVAFSPDGKTLASVGLRPFSKSGGPTIDIVPPGGTPLKVHIQQ